MSRLELEGELQRLRTERFRLAAKVPTKAKALKDIIDKVTFRQVQEVDFEGAAALAEELKELKWQIVAILAAEKRIERELNG